MVGFSKAAKNLILLSPVTGQGSTGIDSDLSPFLILGKKNFNSTCFKLNNWKVSEMSPIKYYSFEGKYKDYSIE